MLDFVAKAPSWFNRISNARGAYVQLRIAEKFVTESIEIVTEMAEFQKHTGFLGQKGFGGSAIWDPELLDYEYNQLRYSTVV